MLRPAACKLENRGRILCHGPDNIGQVYIRANQTLKLGGPEYIDCFAPDIAGSLVFTETDEPRVAQMTVAGPFEEFELSDQHRLQPTAVCHLRLRQSLSPTAALGLRQIGERTVGDLERP